MDRIYEAYMGGMGDAFAEKTRKRIHWICSKVQGQNILDVGCSQGITAILLARQGLQVTGLDISEESVDRAKQYLSEESEEIQARVAFRQADFGCFSSDQHYDTIIMGEVLEHLLHPTVFIANAAKLLKNNGHLVITVPFGINDDPDHKQTFFYFEIIHILEQYFQVTETVFLGKWVGFVAQKNSPSVRNQFDYEECLQVEQAFYAVEREYITNRTMLMGNNQKSSATIKELQLKLKNTTDSLQNMQKEIEDRTVQLNNLIAEGQKLTLSLSQANTHNQELTASLNLANDRNLELSESLNLANDRNLELSESLNLANDRNRELTKTVLVDQSKFSATERKLQKTLREVHSLQRKYNTLSNSKLGKLTLWYWRLRHKNKVSVTPVQESVATLAPPTTTEAPIPLEIIKNDNDLPSITVVIPTYKSNKTLEEAVTSVLQQDYPVDKIKIVLAVNGKNKDYAEWLTKLYESEQRILVVYTPTAGAGAGRNFGKKFIETEWATYLDDDDYFTPGFLREMAKNVTPNTTVVCGRLIDLLEDNSLDQETYLVRALRKAGEGIHATPWKLQSMFSGPVAKLYRTSQLLNVWGDFDENLKHTEDTAFWVDNLHKPMNETVACSSNSTEAYVRRKLDNSLSRPSPDKAFAFYITDRISLIERFSVELLKDGRSLDYKRFVLNKIQTSVNFMVHYYEDASPEEQQRIRDKVNANSCPFLNKGLFAVKRGIAFCHNFAPVVDASAFVASKRLHQLNDHIGETLAWTVVCANMASKRATDPMWEMFFAKFQYVEKRVTQGNVYFNEAAQVAWAEQAFALVQDEEVPYIYSRSMWAGSHVAALKYKQKYPNTFWIAEFSDPIYMGTDNQQRKASKVYEGDEAYLNTFWKDIETAVFEQADQIIFTNANQVTYMLAHNPVETDVRSKSLVWHHPRINSCYAKVMPTNYKLDDNNINIGYFGTFYHNRSADAILMFLENPKVHLHIFTNVTPELEAQMKEISERIHLNPLVSHLEVFGISENMDYLFLNDIQFPGELVPYLPSKLADYLSVDTPVLGLVYPNTPMSEMKEHNLLKFDPTDKSIIHKLNKKQHIEVVV